MRIYSRKIDIDGVGACVCYARENPPLMWYNSSNPVGCSFEPESDEDLAIYNETIKHGRLNK